ncbi:MAG: septal ring lytic transglycosylase RlpA family protein [Cyanobacteria bacterium J06555_13]
MDLAPALPPSQDAVPVLMSSAADLPPSAFPTSTLALGVTSDEPPIQISSGFLSSGLGQSFSLLSRFWRSAQLGSLMSHTRYSSTIALRQVRTQSWNGSAYAADIQVKRVTATPQTAQIENSVWAVDYIQQCLPGADRQLQAGPRYKISIGDRPLGYVADETKAYLLAQQLKRLISQASFDPKAIAAYPIQEGMATADNTTTFVGTPAQPFFTVDDTVSEAVGYSSDWAGVTWANNLRLALDVSPLTPGDALKGLNNLEDSTIDMKGEASWYGPYFHGRTTANGETYNQNDLTVAHKSLPFGTQLQVRNLVNGKTVVVRVNDRGPYVGDRILDLSKAAADCLGSDQAGVIPVEAVILKAAN